MVRRSLSSRVVGRLKERRGDKAPRLGPPGDVPNVAHYPPIFVVGCQRSGTSLLRRILDSHSRIACPPESKFILPLAELLRSRKALKGLDSMGYERDEVAIALARFISTFFEGYAQAQGKARWADKTPDYVSCLPELWELFGQEARFVLIIRNGLDVAFSLSDPHRHFPCIDDQVEKSGGDVPLAAGRFWAQQNRLIESFRTAHPEACHQVRYENLTANPSDTLQELFAWLDEPWEPGVLDYDNHTHHEGYEDPDVRRRRRIESNTGRYKAWPDAIQQSVRRACEPMLSELGYK